MKTTSAHALRRPLDLGVRVAICLITVFAFTASSCNKKPKEDVERARTGMSWDDVNDMYAQEEARSVSQNTAQTVTRDTASSAVSDVSTDAAESVSRDAGRESSRQKPPGSSYVPHGSSGGSSRSR